MKRILTGAVGFAVAAVATGGVLVGSAHAAAKPPWEPDPSSAGGLTFYDSTGAAITGGSTSDPIAAYVEGNAAVRAGDSTATLYGALPISGTQPTSWTSEQLSGKTSSYPNNAAPGALATATNPVTSPNADDETVAELVTDLPNTDTASDGYARAYQIRLFTSGPQESPTSDYDSADIQISSDGSTWSLVYSKAPGAETTTTLKASPKSASVGDTVKLKATVSPSAAVGTVKFEDGSKTLKSVAVSGGSASYSTKALKAGTHSLKAVFVPTGTDYAPSTSAVQKVKVQALPTKTKLKASSKSVKAGKKLTLTATEKPAVAGKVTFLDGSKKLGKPVKVKKGKATFTTTKLKKGTHSLKAKFTPTSKADAGSTSKAVNVKVKA